MVKKLLKPPRKREKNRFQLKRKAVMDWGLLDQSGFSDKYRSTVDNVMTLEAQTFTRGCSMRGVNAESAVSALGFRGEQRPLRLVTLTCSGSERFFILRSKWTYLIFSQYWIVFTLKPVHRSVSNESGILKRFTWFCWCSKSALITVTHRLKMTKPHKKTSVSRSTSLGGLPKSHNKLWHSPRTEEDYQSINRRQSWTNLNTLWIE